MRNMGFAVLWSLVFGAVSAGHAGAATTTFRVTVPNSTPAADTVFVAGSFQSWNPGDPAYALTRQPDGRWQITLNLPDGQPVDFKFTRGSWARVEKGPNGEEIANRQITPNGTETHDFTVAAWADLGTIVGHVESFSHAPFLGGRRIWVYLPPGYAESTDRYPVLYMHDGQNLFDVRTSFSGEWKVDEACENLIRNNVIAPLIVIGIENSAARCAEYTPWPDPAAPCGGGGGDAYLTAIRDFLIPEVNVRYRTLTGPSNTWMSGSSLGGLISAYAGYTYPETWGRIAAVSPSYWWLQRSFITYAQLQGKPDLERFYHDMGTIESGQMRDTNGNGIDDNIDGLRMMRDVALGQGFVLGQDFFHVEAEGHIHNEFWWSQRFPSILQTIANPAVVSAPGPGVRAGVHLVATPNPAPRQTVIELTLPRAGEASLAIADVRGRVVRRLFGGELAAGAHRWRWDGRSDDGRPLGGGVYWAVASTAAGVDAAKIVLLR